MQSKRAEPVAEASYVKIVKSSALIGGSSAINIGLRIVRIKVVAMLLGPSGVGLTGLYTSITDLAGAFVTLGIESSGVRQIAEAAASGDPGRLARTTTILRRLAFFLGLLGATVICLLSQPISMLTFGDNEHAAAVIALSLIIWLGALTAAQRALLQGMRRIADLAAMNVLGGVLSVVLSIAFVCVWGERGIVPLLVAGAGATALTAWWYARKITVTRVTMTWPEFRNEAGALLGLGLVFMSSTAYERLCGLRYSRYDCADAWLGSCRTLSSILDPIYTLRGLRATGDGNGLLS